MSTMLEHLRRKAIIRGEAHPVSALLDRPSLEKKSDPSGCDYTLVREPVSVDGVSVDALASSSLNVVDQYDVM